MKIINKFKNYLNKRKLFKTALKYNCQNTLRSMWNNDTGSWKCPTCNKIHKSTGWNPFTGSEYQQCCDIKAGHRCNIEHGVYK